MNHFPGGNDTPRRTTSPGENHFPWGIVMEEEANEQLSSNQYPGGTIIWENNPRPSTPEEMIALNQYPGANHFLWGGGRGGISSGEAFPLGRSPIISPEERIVPRGESRGKTT